MSRRLALAIVLVARAAFAQPGPDDPAPVEKPEPDHAFAIEPSIGGLGPVGGIAMATLAATWRSAPGAQTWWRVAISPGMPIGDVQGHVLAARAGVEYRRAHCGPGCLYAGLDLEVIDDDELDYPEEYELRGALLVARGGIDVGGDTLRFRLGLEIYAGAGRYHDKEPDLVMPLDQTTTRFAGGMSLTTAFAARF